MNTRLHNALRIYETTVALIVLIAALLLPRISAVVVEFIPGADVVIICTGSEYVKVSLDEDGAPVEVHETQDSDCLRSLALVVAETPSPLWQTLARNYSFTFSLHEHPAPSGETLKTLEPSRAPPVLI
jgi:hypothetical protein